MKNRLGDLRDHLFETIETLRAASGDEAVKLELARARGVSEVAKRAVELIKAEVSMIRALDDAGVDLARLGIDITQFAFVPAAQQLLPPPATPAIKAPQTAIDATPKKGRAKPAADHPFRGSYSGRLNGKGEVQ